MCCIFRRLFFTFILACGGLGSCPRLYASDIPPPPLNTGISQLVSLGDSAVFLAYNPQYGTELWRTDGTPAGTRLLKDTLPGVDSGLFANTYTRFTQQPARITAGTFYWGKTQKQWVLWKTDGTQAGTLPLQTFPALDDEVFSLETTLIPLNERVLFWVDDGKHGLELWCSDGTPQGTQLLVDATQDQHPANKSLNNYTPEFLVKGQNVYFSVPDKRDNLLYSVQNTAYSLWRTDGTPQGTQRVTALALPTQSAHLLGIRGNSLFYGLINAQYQQELWQMDLVSKAKTQITTLPSKLYDRGIGFPLLTNDKLYFWQDAADEHNNTSELWVSDGTAKGTQSLLSLLNPEYRFYSEPFEFARQVYFFGLTGFAATNQPPAALWRTDGTRQGTQAVQVPHLPDEYGQQKPFVILNSHLLFAAANPWSKTHPASYLQSLSADKPEQAVTLGKYLNITLLAPAGQQITGKLLFIAGDALWQTDGTAAGTHKITSLHIPPTQQAVNYDSDTLFSPPVILDNGKYLFTPLSASTTLSQALWVTDGTAAGTHKLLALPPAQ